MNERYPFAEIEPKWQDYWEREGLFAVDTADADRKYYLSLIHI